MQSGCATPWLSSALCHNAEAVTRLLYPYCSRLVCTAATWWRKKQSELILVHLLFPSSQISTKFSNNVLDATKAYKKLITNKDEVRGAGHSCTHA